MVKAFTVYSIHLYTVYPINLICCIICLEKFCFAAKLVIFWLTDTLSALDDAFLDT